MPWAPTLGLRLDLAVDGLGVLYGLVATGIAVLVITFILITSSLSSHAIARAAAKVASGDEPGP